MTVTSNEPYSSAVHAALRHRGRLAPDLRPEPTLFQRIGGRSVIVKVIDSLYDRIELDSDLRPMFTRTLAPERMKQKAFLEEWMGGEPGYTHHHAYGGIKNRHGHIHITPESAERWLAHMTDALCEHVRDDRLVNEALATLGPLARGLVNEKEPPESPGQLRCYRERRWRQPAKMAARGQVEALENFLDEDSTILEDPRHGAIILMEAALRGHTRVAALLLDRGVDVNIPSAHSSDIMMTAYCAARSKRKDDTAGYLADRGAVYDIFSACFLGDMDRVVELLDAHPGLVNANDPACDLLPVTPMHHAVFGGHEHVARFLFETGAETGVNSTALVKYAAERGQASLVRPLLAHGADASRIGCGRWVLDPKISALLLARGADVNYPDGNWIWTACTGNNSQRDDPAYVQALLDKGARIDTVLRGAQSLHFAAKAGFTGVMEVLLKNGAQVDGRNDKGETPLFYALKAGPRADIVKSVKLLLSHGADPKIEDRLGKTPLAIARRMKRPDKARIVSVFEAASPSVPA